MEDQQRAAEDRIHAREAPTVITNNLAARMYCRPVLGPILMCRPTVSLQNQRPTLRRHRFPAGR